MVNVTGSFSSVCLLPVLVCNILYLLVCVSGVKMRKFAYCKVVLATSLVWVMIDMFILLYFSECNKCDDKKERGLPGRDSEYTVFYFFLFIFFMFRMNTLLTLFGIITHEMLK